MIAFPTNHALMPHVDGNGHLVSRALVVHPPRRRNRQTPSTIALQQSVSAATTGAQGTFHVSALGPSPVQTPSVHTKRPQLCCSMLSRSAPCRNSLCFLLMSFDDSTRGLVVFTFSLLPPSQVWSVHCRLGSNCESFFDSCSVGIDSSCTGGTVRPAVTHVFSL